MLLTQDEIMALFEVLGRIKLSERELTVFDKLDDYSGRIKLFAAEKRVLMKVARTLESYEIKKYRINKNNLLMKLRY